jgi:hypothetical protein
MPYKIEKSFLEMNDEYHLMYLRFLKDARIWNSMGQYRLSNEYTNRAKFLLNGNLNDALKPIQSEQFYVWF